MDNNIYVLDNQFLILQTSLIDDYQESLKRPLGERPKSRLSGSILYTQPDPKGYGYQLIDKICTETGLSNYDRNDYKYLTFNKDTNLKIHKDRHTPCWLGIVVKGQQPIYTYDDTDDWRVPGKCNGSIEYKIALVNGDGWHCVPIYKTNIERVLLRTIFFNVDFHEAVDTIKNGYNGEKREPKIIQMGPKNYSPDPETGYPGHPRMVEWYA